MLAFLCPSSGKEPFDLGTCASLTRMLERWRGGAGRRQYAHAYFAYAAVQQRQYSNTVMLLIMLFPMHLCRPPLTAQMDSRLQSSAVMWMCALGACRVDKPVARFKTKTQQNQHTHTQTTTTTTTTTAITTLACTTTPQLISFHLERRDHKTTTKIANTTQKQKYNTRMNDSNSIGNSKLNKYYITAVVLLTQSEVVSAKIAAIEKTSSFECRACDHLSYL